MRQLKVWHHSPKSKSSLLKLDHPQVNSTYKIHNLIGIRLLTNLCLGLSHLNEHKFRHNFADCVTPFCSCKMKHETTLCFFMHYRNFLNTGRKLLDNIKVLDENHLQLIKWEKFTYSTTFW